MRFACFNRDGVWGVGDTKDQARAEAEGFYCDRFKDQNDPALLRTLATLDVAPVDDELVDDIAIHGPGFINFEMRDGRLVWCEEPIADDEELALC